MRKSSFEQYLVDPLCNSQITKFRILRSPDGHVSMFLITYRLAVVEDRIYRVATRLARRFHRRGSGKGLLVRAGENKRVPVNEISPVVGLP